MNESRSRSYEPRPRFKLPIHLVVVDIVGALIAGLGVWGLVEPSAAGQIPLLGIAGAPVAALILGVGLMGYAIFGILRIARDSARGRL
ncbi:MAG: hypothetical protein ABIU95_15060 [Burkholderiales bacterium]